MVESLNGRSDYIGNNRNIRNFSRVSDQFRKKQRDDLIKSSIFSRQREQLVNDPKVENAMKKIEEENKRNAIEAISKYGPLYKDLEHLPEETRSNIIGELILRSKDNKE